jgi:hypothetical protein
MAKKPEPVLIFCTPCGTGYGSNGEKPTICPACRSTDPQWTRTPPYRLTADDRDFLRSLRIKPI